jgi:hypothetical protein
MQVAEQADILKTATMLEEDREVWVVAVQVDTVQT